MEWISVQDRLPNIEDPVLLLVCGKITQGYLFNDFEFDECSMEQKPYQGFQNEFSDDCLEWMDVTHWMPLPKPPKQPK